MRENGKRILIIGSPGSGKSTLAHHLHKMYGIPLYHMDIINWIDNKTTISQEELIEQLNQIIAKILGLLMVIIRTHYL